MPTINQLVRKPRKSAKKKSKKVQVARLADNSEHTKDPDLQPEWSAEAWCMY